MKLNSFSDVAGDVHMRERKDRWDEEPSRSKRGRVSFSRRLALVRIEESRSVKRELELGKK